MPEKVVIIGSGPAGWTAAIYAARANLEPLVYEGIMSQKNQDAGRPPLGQLALTTEVENFPGFPVAHLQPFLKSAIAPEMQYMMFPPPQNDEKHAVTGPDLMLLMKQQALNFGTRVVSDDISEVDFDSKPFKLTALGGDVVEAQTVIIATGASANYLGLESEKKYMNRGVSACAVCDGALPRFRGKPLIVVGGGDSAVEEATYLANLGSDVSLIHRRDELRASKVMAQRAINHPKINIVWNSTIEEVLGNDEEGVTGARLKSTVDGSTSELEATGFFVAIGHTPNTGFLKGKLEMTDKRYLRWTQAQRTNTSVDGVFAAGDVADDYYRQAVTAAASGCMSALDAERYLVSQGH